MTDKEIQQAVLRELDWEPQVTSTEIGVAIHDAVVTLAGLVENFKSSITRRRPPSGSTASRP
jgi:osmotically-inducible protein OsmY